MLENSRLSGHFSFLLFECLSSLLKFRMVFPSLCHFTGPLLEYLQQIIHPFWCPDLKNYSLLLFILAFHL